MIFKNNSKYIESQKIKTSFVLFGKSFSDEYTFIDLINNLIDEFILENFPFTMSIYEVNSVGTFDLVSNKYFKYYDDTINSSKIYFEPLNYNFFEVLYDTLDKIKINYKMKTIGSHIFITFENIYQKVKIYNLEDLNIKSKKILSMDSTFIKSEISNLFSLLNNSPIKDKSLLIKMLQNDLNHNNLKVLFRFCQKRKLLNLTSAFYNNFESNKSDKLVLYKEIDSIKKYDFNNNKINKSFNINNMATNYKIIKPVSSHNLNNMSSTLIKYNPKAPIKSPIKKETKVITPKEYTEKQKPIEIIKVFNLFNDQKLINSLVHSGSSAGEAIWQLPLVDDYRELISSPLADVKNITGTRWGGTITAGLFLQEFVKHSSWAHIDLAGCWSSRERDYRPYGPTGEGPRFLIDWLLNSK